MATPQVQIDVALEVKAARKALQSLDNQFTSFASENTRKIRRIDGAFSSFFGNLAANATGRIFSSLTSGIANATKESFNFIRAQKEIETILPNNAKLTALTVNQLDQLSRQYGTSAQSQAKSFYQTISAGITDQVEATKLLTAANQLATGGIADVQGSVELLAKTLNVFGSENITAQQAADALFTTVRLGITTIPSLNGALAQVLPTAKAAGLSFDEVNAALAVLTKNGLSTEEATTRLNRLLSELSKRSGQLGSDFQIGGEKGLRFADVLRNISKTTDDSAIGTNRLFNNVRSVSASLILARDGANEFGDALSSYSEKAGAAGRASDKILREDTLKKFEILEANINSVVNTFVQDWLPTINRATNALNDFLNPKEVSALDAVNQEISKTRVRLNELIDLRDKTGAVGFITSFFRAGKAEKELLDDLKAQEKEIKRLLKIRATLLKTPEPTDDAKGVAEKVKTEQAKASQIIDEAAQKRAIKTQELLAQQLVAEEEALLRSAQLQRELSAEELERLGQLEQEKINIKFDARQAELQLIQNEEDKIAKLNQLNTKRELERIKTAQKTKKDIRQQELKDEQTFFNLAKSLSQSENKSLAAIGKAAGLLQIAQATPPAIASSFNFGSRIGGPPLGFAFAGIAAAAQAAQAAQLAKFENGGFVGASLSTGDRNIIRVNNDEAVLNTRQQREFMRLANGSGGQGGGEMVEKIDELINAVNAQPVSIQVDGRELIRVMRNEQRAQGVA